MDELIDKLDDLATDYDFLLFGLPALEEGRRGLYKAIQEWYERMKEGEK